MREAALVLVLLAALTSRSSAEAALTTVQIPLILDGWEVAEVGAFFTQREALAAVDGEGFVSALRPYLRAERLADLTRRVDAEGRLSPDAIRGCGIDFFFDAARLEARVGILAALRPVTRLNLAHIGDEVAENAVPPAARSGYVNFLAGGGFSQGNLSGAGSGWQRPVFDFDGSLRVSSTVLEGVVTHSGQDGVPWQRQDFRIVYDRPAARVRTALGDVNYDIRGFQAFQRMGGIATARNVNLQRARSSAPSASTTLVLERSSRVEVWINGQRSQTLQLAAGRYDIRNFPLALGTNDVELRLTDEVGRADVVSFPFVFDSALLDRGEEDFGYAAGFLSQTTPQGRSYDVETPAASAYHALGLSKQITAGINAQGSPRQLMVGAEGLWATAFGTLLADFAGSRSNFAAAGGAARLQYRYSDTVARTDVHSWSATATFRSPTFTTLGDLVPSNPYALDVGVVYGRRLLWGVLGSFGLGRQLGRSGQSGGSTEDLTLSHPFGRGLLATLALSRRTPAFDQSTGRILMTLEWMFGGVNSVTASQDSAADTSRLQWNHSAAQRVRSADADVVLTRDRSSETSQGDAHYRDYRFSADAAGSSEQDRTHGTNTNSLASFDLGTALAFADGQAALSRPITDSFVIVAPNPSLEGKEIEVNVGGGIPAAKTGPLGPAVLPELTSYDRHRVDVSAPDLPPWIDLGPQPRYVYPSYRSGTRLVAGKAAAIVIEGRLVDDAGRPLSLEPGDIQSVDEPGRPSQPFFTAKTGHFAVEGLGFGRLRIVMRNFPDNPIFLTISLEDFGIVDVGTIRVSPGK